LNERAVDFAYETCHLRCPECGDRFAMSFEDRDNGIACECPNGHDASESWPELADTGDPAVGDHVTALSWYHTSTRLDWPPTDNSPEAIATHLGTFEAAAESMFWRMRHYQGDLDKQFYLYRVELDCELTASRL
jgi:hypothetical protein